MKSCEIDFTTKNTEIYRKLCIYSMKCRFYRCISDLLLVFSAFLPLNLTLTILPVNFRDRNHNKSILRSKIPKYTWYWLYVVRHVCFIDDSLNPSSFFRGFIDLELLPWLPLPVNVKLHECNYARLTLRPKISMYTGNCVYI